LQLCRTLLRQWRDNSLSTPEAIHVFNKSNAKKIGPFHVTC
jgi:hypothetical protein